jgi:hypothetical protein
MKLPCPTSLVREVEPIVTKWQSGWQEFFVFFATLTAEVLFFCNTRIHGAARGEFWRGLSGMGNGRNLKLGD